MAASALTGSPVAERMIPSRKAVSTSTWKAGTGDASPSAVMTTPTADASRSTVNRTGPMSGLYRASRSRHCSASSAQ